MTVHYVVANPIGEITGYGTCQESTALMQDPPGGISVRVDDEELWNQACQRRLSYRVVGGLVVRRLPIEPEVSQLTFVANGDDLCVIAGLPPGAAVSVSGSVSATGEVGANGIVELSSTSPGALLVRVSLNPTHTPWQVKLNAL